MKIKIKTVWGTIECSESNIKQSFDDESLIIKTNAIDMRIPLFALTAPVNPIYVEKEYAFLKWKNKKGEMNESKN